MSSGGTEMAISAMRKKRKSSGFRLIDLAEKTGISTTWLWSLENGYKKGISREIKLKVAQVLDSTTKELFGE